MKSGTHANKNRKRQQLMTYEKISIITVNFAIKKIKHRSKFEHFSAENHILLESFVASRYIYFNPDFDKFDEIMRKYVNIYNKKYDEIGVYCLIKMITNTNNIEYIRTVPKHYVFYINSSLKNSFFNRIKKERDNSSKMVEMRITFVSSYRFMSCAELN